MKTNNLSQPPVAIIGMGCLFAKSPDSKGFLRLLMGGINGITDPPSSHQQLKDCFNPDPNKPDHIYCNRGGFLPQVEFDPTEFGIPPNNLEATDTSQLLGLVIAKKALDDAGYGDGGKAMDRSKCSIILGVTGTQELVIPLGARLGHPNWRRALAQAGINGDQAEAVIKNIADGMVEWQENSFPGLLGNVVAGRIANRLDLGGTNCVVDAACASSMGAIRTAVLELAGGHSDVVITGGVDTINDAFMHMCFSRTRILSPSGDIRPFSVNADGTVLGEGIGLIVLKRLEDAERDQDRIYAVIKGIGSSSDGRSQSIYAPRPEGQTSALRRAYALSGIEPAAVELIEAHGTGTRVGDQVEFKSLCEVFGSPQADSESRATPCALGSVKSNIGHTKAAAGTAGLIKCALSLYHKVLPPTLKAEEPDPKLALQESRFYLNTRLRPWIKKDANKRCAGVSAFGFGGSNFHAVLEEYDPQKAEPAWNGQIEIVAFSSTDQSSLEKQFRDWDTFLKKDPDQAVRAAQAAHTRVAFNAGDSYRMVFVLDNADDIGTVRQQSHAAGQWLSGWTPEQRPSGNNNCFIGKGPPNGSVACLFPGQGSQYIGMGRDIVCCFPESLNVLQEAERNFSGPRPLGEFIYPLDNVSPEDNESQLRSTRIAQPALGAVSMAMFAALKRFGLQPAAACGHSYGELTALHAAGWIAESDFWRLSAERGRLMAEAGRGREESGTMLAVQAPLEDLKAMAAGLSSEVVLANLNSPTQGVFSGSTKAIEHVRDLCREKAWRCIQLPVAAAFHSPWVSDAREPFQHLVDEVPFSPNSVHVMSNTSGAAYPASESEARNLLGRQLANPVDFVSNIQHLYTEGIRTFVEVGPKAVLTSLVKAILANSPIQTLSLDRSAGREHGLADFARVIGALAAWGYDIHLGRWEKPSPRKQPARMAVKLSGANYRDPHKRPVISPGISSVISDDRSDVPPDSPQTTLKNTGDLNKMNTLNKQDLRAALAAVQQGMTSITELQNQTAQAHGKFLESQTQAGKTLMQIMQQVQQLSAAAMGTTIPPVPVDLSVPALAVPALAQMSAPHMDTPDFKAFGPQMDSAVTEALPAYTAGPVSEQVEKAIAPTPASEAGDDKSLEVTKILVGIVGELTGYPEEMLGLDLDIESDLGIDSIKRVEILSALEEKMPSLPKVTPDMMGSLKTIGQICEYLCASDNPAASASVQARPPFASPETSAPPVSADTNHQNIDDTAVQKTLVGIVGELTGYPEEMLGLDLDIESDLGIDSIKRVEILSALEEKMPSLPKVTPDMMGSLKTLGQICAYLSESSTPESTAVLKSDLSDKTANMPTPPSMKPEPNGDVTGIARQTIRITHRVNKGKMMQGGSPSAPVGLVCSRSDLAEALMEKLQHKGFEVRRMSKPDEIDSCNSLSGMLLVAPLSAESAFQWAKACQPILSQPAATGNAFFYTLSFMDGAFGFKGKKMPDPHQGALAGLIKTAAIEWPSIRCGALDIDLDIDPDWKNNDEIATVVSTEVLTPDPDGPLEIGFSGPAERIVLELVNTPVPAPMLAEDEVDLHPQDVVVVTGGARGVTAAAAIALAQRTGCRLALCGRSPAPQNEPDWLSGLQAESEIKRAILDHQFKGKSALPKDIESAYFKWTANRQVRHTLSQLENLGVQARYYPVDVCDAEGVALFLQKVRKELGPVKGLIHGAGVLEDRFIIDKQLHQFQRVFNTKVKGLESLLAAAQDDALRYLVCFSSVTARMGNSGQADYAMANEVLNKMARQYQLAHPDCKVVSINWGPWDGGMVTPALKRNFLKQQVDLIPVEQGVQAMLAEMAAPVKDVEIVLGAPLIDPIVTDDPISSKTALATAARRDIDVDSYPILRSHLLNGQPVVPLALITEWLAHSALHANPGLALHGIDDLRLLKGITLEQQKQSIRLMAGKLQRIGEHYEVDTEIRNGIADDREVIHSSAKIILSDRLPSPPDFHENGHFKGRPMPFSLEEAYDHVLFHGQDLRGIRKIIGISDRGMSARISAAPSPGTWVRDPLRSRWIADPLVLDGAFQMAILWCYEQFKQVSLPAYAAAYRQYCHTFPKAGVMAVLEVTRSSNHKMTGDFTFLDEEKRVVAQLDGFEAIMNRDLIQKFHPN